MSNRPYKNKNSAGVKRLIGIAGKKQSGKNSAANFIAGINLVMHGIIDEFKSLDDGSIEVDGKQVNVNEIDPTFIKTYGFADYLKYIVCNLFNIDQKLAFGSDADKETVTDLLWEDMPSVMTNYKLFKSIERFVLKKEELLGKEYTDKNFKITYHDPGNMTVREVLQFFGSEVCRSMMSSCWINYLINTLKQESPKIAIVTDMRYDNEAKAVKDCLGITIMMERCIKEDSHSSENGISSQFIFDARVPNQSCKDIRCLNRLLYEHLQPLGLFSNIYNKD